MIKTRKSLLFLSVAACALALPQVSNAGPLGGEVVGGSASITQNASKTDIHQSSQKAILDWRSFDVGTSEHVEFHQPNAQAIALNRIKDTKLSQIDGKLTANGNVMLMNPNGVVFGKGSQVDVGSLTATTADIDNDKFMNGDMAFDKAGKIDGKVVNHGNITAKEAGLVNFVAPQVENHGVIAAKLGKVNLAAADTFTLDMAGDGLTQVAVSHEEAQKLARNTGHITAEGGYVALTAGKARNIVDSLVENTGVIEASSMTKIGGKIVLSGSHTKLSGTVKANGKTGGGEILIGGDYQGKGDTQTATITDVSKTATITANATDNGDGGKVIVWADKATRFEGKIEAKGGEQGGNGGFAEVSGKQYLDYRGTADLRAPQGERGTLLLDPDDLFIQDSGDIAEAMNALGGDPYQFDTGNDISYLATETIETQLGLSDVLITTNAAGAGNGDIFVYDNISAANGYDLSLEAHGDLTFDVNGDLDGDTGQVINIDGHLSALSGTSGAGYIDIVSAINADGGITLNSAGNISGNNADVMNAATASLTAGNFDILAGSTINLGDTTLTDDALSFDTLIRGQDIIFSGVHDGVSHVGGGVFSAMAHNSITVNNVLNLGNSSYFHAGGDITIDADIVKDGGSWFTFNASADDANYKTYYNSLNTVWENFYDASKDTTTDGDIWVTNNAYISNTDAYETYFGLAVNGAGKIDIDGVIESDNHINSGLLFEARERDIQLEDGSIIAHGYLRFSRGYVMGDSSPGVDIISSGNVEFFSGRSAGTIANPLRIQNTAQNNLLTVSYPDNAYIIVTDNAYSDIHIGGRINLGSGDQRYIDNMGDIFQMDYSSGSAATLNIDTLTQGTNVAVYDEACCGAGSWVDFTIEKADLGGDLSVISKGDIIIGKSPGAAIDASASSGNVILAADTRYIDWNSNESNGAGSITMGNPNAYINLGGSANLYMAAGDGIDVKTQGISNVAARSNTGDITIENFVSGDMNMVDVNINDIDDSHQLPINGVEVINPAGGETITLSNSGGDIIVDDAITHSSDVSQSFITSGAGNKTILGQDITTDQGDISFDGAVQLTNNITLDAGNGAILIGSGGIDASNKRLRMYASDFTINGSLTGSDTLSLRAANNSMGIGTGQAGVANLSDAELDFIQDGWKEINISSGFPINVGAYTWRDNLYLNTNSSLTINGAQNMGSNDLRVSVGVSPNINAPLIGTGVLFINNAISIGDDVTATKYSDSELAMFQDGWSEIIFNTWNNDMVVDTAGYEFSDPVSFFSGGDILLRDTLAGAAESNASFKFGSIMLGGADETDNIYVNSDIDLSAADGTGTITFENIENLFLNADLTTGGGNIIIDDTVATTNVPTTDIDLDADSGTISIGSGGINAGTNNLYLRGEDFDIGGDINGREVRFITNNNVGLGLTDSESGMSAHLSDAELNHLRNLTYRAYFNANDLQLGEYTWDSSVYYTGTNISVNGTQTINGGNDLTLLSNNPVINADLVGTGGVHFHVVGHGNLFEIGDGLINAEYTNAELAHIIDGWNKIRFTSGNDGIHFDAGGDYSFADPVDFRALGGPDGGDIVIDSPIFAEAGSDAGFIFHRAYGTPFYDTYINAEIDISDGDGTGDIFFENIENLFLNANLTTGGGDIIIDDTVASTYLTTADVDLDADSGTISIGSGGINADGYDLEFSAEDFDIGGNISGDRLNLHTNNNVDFGIGTGQAGTAQLDDTELAYFQDGFNQISFKSLYSGDINVGTYAWNDSVYFETNGGAINILGDQVFDRNARLSAQYFNINGRLTGTHTLTFNGGQGGLGDNMLIGDNIAGTQLSDTELGMIQDGWDLIDFVGYNSNGVEIGLNGYEFVDPVSFSNGGDVTVSHDLIGAAGSNASFTFTDSNNSTDNLNINANIDLSAADGTGSILFENTDNLVIAADLITGGGDITFEDSVAAVNLSGDTIFDTGTGRINIGTSGIVGGAHNLTLRADDLALNGAVTTSQDLIINPYTSNHTIGLGGGLGDMSIDDTELGFLTVEGLLTIGNSASGALHLDGFDFATITSQDVALQGADIILDGVNGAGNSILITTDGSIVLNGSLSAIGANDSIVMTAVSFINNGGSGALNPGAGRFLIYAPSPDDVVKGGLVAENLYSNTYPAIIGPSFGNSFIFGSDKPFTPEPVQPTVKLPSTVEYSINRYKPSIAKPFTPLRSIPVQQKQPSSVEVEVENEIYGDIYPSSGESEISEDVSFNNYSDRNPSDIRLAKINLLSVEQPVIDFYDLCSYNLQYCR